MPMVAGRISVKVKVSMAWWWSFYAFGLLTAVYLTDAEPDWVKVVRVIKRAIRMRIE